MKPMQGIQQILTWLCAYPTGKDTHKSKRLLCTLIGVIMIVTSITCFFATLAFFLKFVKTDLERCLFTLYQFGGMINLLYNSIVLMRSQYKLKIVFDQLTEIYDASEYIEGGKYSKFSPEKQFASSKYSNTKWFIPISRCSRSFVLLFDGCGTQNGATWQNVSLFRRLIFYCIGNHRFVLDAVFLGHQ